MASILELLGDSSNDPTEPVDQPSAFSQGLRSGVTSLEGQGHALVGRGAELVGADDLANEQYARSQELQAQAATEAPKTRFKDIDGLRSGYDYATGLAGQMIPTVLPAVAASILTKRPIAAPTAVFAPVETADIIQRQQANPNEAAKPVGARSKDALLGGVASAAAQSIVPGMVGERVAGHTAAQAAKMGLDEIAGRAATSTALGGLATPGGEGIKEIASGQDLNPEALKESAAAGLVGAGLISVPGAVAEGAHGALSRAGTSVGDLASAGVAKTKEAVSKGAQNVTDLYGRASRSVADHAGALKDDSLLARSEPDEAPADTVARSDKTASDVATDWLKGKLAESGLDPEVKAHYSDLLSKVGNAAARQEIGARIIAEKTAQGAKDLYDHLTSSDTGERVRSFVNDTLNSAMQSIDDFKSKSIGERVAETRQYIDDLMNDPSTRDDVKTKLIDAAQNIGDRAKQLYVVNLAKARDLAQQAKDIGDEKVQTALKSYGEGVGLTDIAKEFAGATTGVKKSEDMSGVRQLVSDELIPAMKDHSPQSINDPETIRKAADSVRMIIDRTRSGERLQDDPKVVDLLSTLVGSKNAVPMLDRVMQKFDNGDVAAKDHGYQFLLDLHNLGAQDSNMARTVRASLVDKKGITDADLKSVVRNMRSYTDGTLMDKFTPAERAMKEAQFHDVLAKEFGPNTDKVLNAFEQDAAARQAALRQGGSDKGIEGEGDIANHNLEEKTPEQETIKRYPDNKLIPSHEAHVREFGNDDSQARRFMDKASEDHPDMTPRFVPARELARERGMSDEELHAITKGRPDDYGQVEVGGESTKDRITEKEAQAMRLDQNHSHSPSAIKTDKATFDAVKITDVMRRKLPYIEGESSADRTRRAFNEGLGAALVHFKAYLGRLDPQTVVAYRNGKPVKAGEVKPTGEAFGLAGQELSKAKANAAKPDKERNVAYGELTDMQLRERAATLQSVMDDRVQRYVTHLKDNGSFPTKEGVKGYVMSEKNKQLRTEMDDVRKEISAREFDKKVEHGQQSDLETEHQNAGLREFPKDADIHTAVAEYGEDGVRVTHDESGQNIERMQEQAARRPESDAAAREPRTMELPKQVTAKAKEPTEHVAARESDIADDAKDAIAGGSTAEGAIAKYANKPQEAKRLIDSILDTKVKTHEQLRNANDAIYKLNDHIESYIKNNPEKSYGMKLKSLEGVDKTTEVSAKTREAIEAHLRDVLGPKVAVEWRNLGHAGEFDNLDIIRMSVHSLNPMGTAYHESLHAFFRQLSDMKQFGAMKTLVRAANSAPVLNQLRKLYADNPEVLKQIDTNPEERVAYMYQNWVQEKIRLGSETKSTFQKVKDFFLRVMGIWTNDARAEHIMDYFNTGEFEKNKSDARKIDTEFNLRGTNEAVEVMKGVMKPVLDMGSRLVTAGSSRMRDTNNVALTRIADLILPEKTRETGDVGYIQASHTEYTARMNKLAKALEGVDEETLTDAFDAIKHETDAKTVGGVKAQKAVYAELRNALNYMKEAGVKIGDLGPKYFPRVWDVDKITKNKDAFVEMLSKSGIKQPEKVAAELIARGGAEESIAIDRPGNAHEKERVLREVSNADAADFVKDNLFDTLNNYMMQATRRAEFARRFNGETDLRALLDEAKDKYGATDKEVKMGEDFVHGVLGTLGDDMNPTVRRFMGNMIVYQNLRLLPFAIFSQAVDPVGILVRGGTVSDAASAFMRGIKEIPRGFQKNKAKDGAYEMAETLGVIENAALANSMSSVYTQGMAGSFARKVNETLFKYNMVEQFNTSMRVAGTEAALRFLARHAEGDYSRHSSRFLGELGLKPGEVIVKDGRPLITMKDFLDHGMTTDQAAASALKMRSAVNRWVDGAVLRPNSAERSIWMNDPHFALFAHLKTFTYAFQHTILDRVWHEIQHDNAAPALALMSYVPIMFASDMAKGYIMGMGEQPDWKKGWGWHQYLNSAVERAGLYGTGQYATDLVRDVQRQNIAFSALGPTYEQVVDGLKTLGGKEQMKTFLIHGMPANAIYSNLLGKGVSAPDPKFVE